MNGVIAQLIAITCHGNAFLHGRSIGRFYPANSTCLFCEKILFTEVDLAAPGGHQGEIVAASPDEWFNWLRKKETTGVQILCDPNKEAGFPGVVAESSFKNGGAWAIEAIDVRGRSRYWVSQWEVSERRDRNENIWKVIYHLLPERTLGETPVVELGSALRHLGENLTSILAFTKDHECGGFSDLFKLALLSLGSDGATWFGYHQDLAPPGILSSDAVRLLDACQIAWVFDRMGLWNNLSFAGEGEYEYQQVSQALFKAIVNGILAAVNQSY